MYKQIAALCLFTFAIVSYGNAQVSGWVDCGSTAIIRELRVGQCTRTPCTFARGNTYNIQFTAVPTAYASTLPYIVNATILGMPWTILEGNGCNELPCPVTPNREFTFHYQYTVSHNYPPIPITVTTIVTDHIAAVIVCFLFDLLVV